MKIGYAAYLWSNNQTGYAPTDFVSAVVLRPRILQGAAVGMRR